MKLTLTKEQITKISQGDKEMEKWLLKANSQILHYRVFSIIGFILYLLVMILISKGTL